MVIVCTSCPLIVQVVEPAHMFDLHAVYECPKCLGQAVSKSVGDVPPEVLAASTTLVLSSTEAFAAFHGAGLRAQRSASPENVQAALVGKRIKSVLVEQTPNMNRSLLLRIGTEDGGMVFLSAGSYGPTVYRLLPPREGDQ